MVFEALCTKLPRFQGHVELSPMELHSYLAGLQHAMNVCISVPMHAIFGAKGHARAPPCRWAAAGDEREVYKAFITGMDQVASATASVSAEMAHERGMCSTCSGTFAGAAKSKWTTTAGRRHRCSSVLAPARLTGLSFAHRLGRSLLLTSRPAATTGGVDGSDAVIACRCRLQLPPALSLCDWRWTT